LEESRYNVDIMPYVNVSGQRLFYADHQPDAPGPALLLLHGAAASHLVWPGPLRRLPDTRVLALDLPGHGRSAPPGRRLIAHYAAAVSAFITALALPEVVIFGHSMGAAIALAVALEPPPGLCGLVLLGAGAQLRVNDLLLGGSLADLERAAGFIVEAGFVDAPEALRQKTRQAILEAGATTTYGDFLACAHFDARSWLPGIDVPVLVISGDADRMTPPRLADALAAGLPNGRRARIAGTGHYAMLERPAELAALLAGFLAELRRSTSGQHAAQ
jgi:pimeloyl-ACP methyl ester carboxylesterase